MTDATTAPSVDDLTRTYVKIRTRLQEKAAAFKEEEAKLKSQLDLIKRALLDYCSEHGVESARTAYGTFYRTTKTRYWTSDWEAMHKFVLQQEVPDFLEKRLNQSVVKQFLEENPEQVPPGLNTDVEYVVTVRKT
jgi:hypothetical protein